jgi:outer membrane receptor protein involved in Fe transport
MKKLLLALLILASTAAVTAQTTSTIEGTVRDPAGAAVADATVSIAGPTVERTVKSDQEGRYQIVAVPPGRYTLTASREGFVTVTLTELTVDLNRTLMLDVGLSAGSIQQTIEVVGEAPLLDRSSPGTGGVVTPEQIEKLPVNGRDYLDLVQLVPGVTVNRAADEGADTATPVLGERAGNAIQLVDGMPNRSEFSGGPATQFNQDSIFEFEVITDGYKAEFGHGSGGVINVVTKSGQNDWRAMAAGFWRDDSLDSSNSLEDGDDAPELDRLDLAANVGGPLVRDRVFMFASAEDIDEDRELNFSFPEATPQSVRDFENSFDQPTHDEETRLFARFDEQIGASHRLTQSVSWNDQDLADFLPLSLATDLPSTRRTFERERTMAGLRDTSMFGDGANPWVFDGYLQYRDDSDVSLPAHPEAGPLTQFNIFSSTSTFSFFGDLGTVNFGSSTTDSEIDQEYGALGSSIQRSLSEHDLKGGVEYLRTKVDGHEFRVVGNQLFATEENFNRFGPIYSGFFTLVTAGGLTEEAAQIRLRNDYSAVYVQDDWKLTDELVVNVGLRWDYDSEFEDDDNFGPRLGIAWSPTPRTVVRASAGIYFDRFRLGTVRDVPPFGGADLRIIQPLSYPQLFENVTTRIPVAFGLCIDPILTTAQIQAAGASCPFNPGLPFYGRDHLSNLVADGRAPVAPQTVVTIDNVQELTGLTPDQYLARVTATVPLLPGFEWFWGPFGALSHTGVPASEFPVTLDPSFETPHTEAYHLGIEHQLGRDWLLGLDLHHRDIEDILGTRVTNLAFVARLPGRTLTFDPPTPALSTTGFGPWYEGEVDAATVSVQKRMRDRWAFTAHYTYTDAEDNLLTAQFGDGNVAGTGPGAPSDSFVGIPPVVVEDDTGRTNADGPFVASNGNPVPQAGVFYNGPDLDRGTSSLALEHTFVVFGQVRLPLNFELAAIFRHQSGFPFSRTVPEAALDIDGDQAFSTRDYAFERNSFEAPDYTSLDARAAWNFDLGRIGGTILLEFFNLTNEQNPAAVETTPGRTTGFGDPLQVLPGREGQLGVRFEFGGT